MHPPSWRDLRTDSRGGRVSTGTRRDVPVFLGVLSFIVQCSCLSGAEPVEGLQLVGLVDGVSVGEVVVENRAIVVRNGETTQALPRDVRWELRGDLRAHASNIAVFPSYQIKSVPALPSTPDARVRTHAIIRVRRGWAWTERQLDGAIMVLTWVIDRKPVWVLPLPAHLVRGASEDYVAVAAFELDEATRRGAPAILARREGRWVPPATAFGQDAADRVLAEICFGTNENLTPAIADLKNVDRPAGRDFHEATLLEFAAQAGNAMAVQALLNAGARPTTESLMWAASYDRRECLAPLVAAGARPRQRLGRSTRTPVDYALSSGHLEMALAMAGDKLGDERNNLFALALTQGDLMVARHLASTARGPLARWLAKEDWAEIVATGDADATSLLLQSGMRPDAVADGIPLLVTAAARGDAASVRALIDAGADVNRSAREGVTALMAASCNGHADAARTLLSAGAEVDASDRHGRTALDYAQMGPGAAVAELLRNAGAREIGEARSPDTGFTKVVEEIMSLRTGGADVLPVTEVDIHPLVVHEAQAAALTRLRQSYQSIYTTTTVTRPLQPGSPVYEVRQIDARGPASAEKLTGHWAAVSLVVEADGSPAHVQIVDAFSEEFGEAVRDAMRNCRFRPGERNGVPVRTRITMAITIDD